MHRPTAQPRNPTSVAYSYRAKGGSIVAIPKVIDPHSTLGLPPSASNQEVKQAFRGRITTPDRQQRALISYARHMLSEAKARYEPQRHHGATATAFDFAISGYTEALVRALDRDSAMLNEQDDSGRTLLYIAARSGYYDTCEALLKRGASTGGCSCDFSTPLHAAAFFGHSLVCSLLVEYGASSEARNVYDNTPADEASDPEVKAKLSETFSSDVISAVLCDCAGNIMGGEMEDVVYQCDTVAKRLSLRPKPEGWSSAWHGTKVGAIPSILEHGLQPAGASVGGRQIKPPPGHYKLGETHFGVKNWAGAVFVSPSFLYAGHPCYSERILSDSKQWCCLVMVAVKPKTFTSHDSTILNADPIAGEPATPEWRVDVQGDDMIWRQGDSSNLVVTGIIFVLLSFFDTIGQAGPGYNEATNLLRGKNKATRVFSKAFKFL
eukprot:CAMPEP_0183305812 /NCGR_PEP_ID=MMETSP0160_2-20130417/10437_1 /TAXON_ID=2839 ORGANISM="Odontella Sinensis, Strain Grunow 1884" /NCGR_SAMPLE_ID=MMETSP0160_2 /ASSEMBLY_ACC=CAM_ASM_000250 /LENGTH=435 /DNA_ID=CAMNT_0025469085 /DNA_START=45 /DNA_END=1352 /DNA_ORIENTATION=-